MFLFPYQDHIYDSVLVQAYRRQMLRFSATQSFSHFSPLEWSSPIDFCCSRIYSRVPLFKFNFSYHHYHSLCLFFIIGDDSGRSCSSRYDNFAEDFLDHVFLQDFLLTSQIIFVKLEYPSWSWKKDKYIKLEIFSGKFLLEVIFDIEKGCHLRMLRNLQRAIFI